MNFTKQTKIEEKHSDYVIFDHSKGRFVNADPVIANQEERESRGFERKFKITFFLISFGLIGGMIFVSALLLL